MKTSRKDISPTKVQLTIALGSEELASAERVALGKLASIIKVPGFRKGKVPPSVAAKNVSASALMEQTLEDAVSKAVATAFTEGGIQALDRPEVEIKKYVPGQEVEFTAEVDIMPLIKLGDYKKLGVTREKSTVKQSEVDDILDRMRQAYAERSEVTRAAKIGDEANIDYEGFKGDTPFDGGKGTKYTLSLGSNTFIPGFEDGVVGHKAGESFDIPLTFPKEYHSKELAGAKVTFKVTLNSVTELTLPPVDDEFAKKSGPFTTADELKADMKAEIKKRKDQEADEAYKEALVDRLVEVSEIPVPDVLLHEQIHRTQDDVKRNLQYRGQTLEQYLEQQGYADETAWHDSEEIRGVAERRIQGGLALAELSKAEKITATEDELNDRMQQMLSQYSDAESQKQLSTPTARNEIANRLLTEKTIDRLVALNTPKK